MKINQQILSIPPYISTSWDEVQSLFLDKDGLIILLKNNLKIRVPIQDDGVLNQVFEGHRKYLEAKTLPRKPKDSISFGLPLNMPKFEDINTLGAAMRHNPDQADSPNLPKEVLTKIASVAKALGLQEQDNLPEAQPHCNCMYCQLARAMNGDATEEEEEKVSDEDLKFRDWDITQESDELYIVTNPLDNKEKYNVFLGNPIGCTCGKNNCEHIRSVLNS
jgi:hypothetical protein